MDISLTSEQLAWLQDKVSSGRFSSIEEAAMAAIDAAMATETEARASVGRGEFLTHDQFKSFIAGERRKLGFRRFQ